jgi:hypothetical protein
MSRDEIIKLARQHGKPVQEQNAEVEYLFTLDEIAALLAAEREACAKLCEETTAAWTQHLYNEGCIDCAKVIRARGKA